MRLLLVEDDLGLQTSIKHDLEQAGFAVDVADNGIDAEHLGNEINYDAIILDLGLPQRSGLEVLKNWRKRGTHVPVIILTARDAWHERVDGFKAGADDYLCKPFYVEELVARLQAVIRRSTTHTGSSLSLSGITLDEERQLAIDHTGQEHSLTGTEFRLLRYFMLYPGQVLSKSRLSEHIYDDTAETGSNVLEVYVRRLRQKLGEELIETRRGQGYIFRKI